MAEEAFVNFAKRRFAVGAKPEEVAPALRVNGLTEQEISDVLQIAIGAAPAQIEAPRPPSPWDAPALSAPAAPRAEPLPTAVPPPTPLPPQPRPLPTLPRVKAPVAPHAMEAASGVVYAGFWRRLCAGLIDVFVMLALSLGVFVAYLISTASMSATFSRSNEIALLSIAGIIVLLYPPIFDASSWRGSIGKYLFGIEVTDMAGHQISFPRALLRYLIAWPSTLLLLGFALCAFTKKKQALQDMATKSLVVQSHSSRVGMVIAIIMLIVGVPAIGYYLMGRAALVQSQLQYSGSQLQDQNKTLQQAIDTTHS